MTYEEAREFISQSNQYGIVPGLQTITELLNRLGNPQDRLHIIHVAGTNGKGSTCAFLTSILCAAGYRVGRYISPSVFSYRERIQISVMDSNQLNAEDIFDMKKQASELNDSCLRIEYITKDGVSKSIEKIKPACESMVQEGFAHPTSFEIETAMTFLYLLSEQVDYVVLEVGMGGRLDATNVIKNPIATIITSISMDHMQYLGDTLEKIAAEKAGIIKPGSPVITCDQKPEVIRVLEQKAKELGVPLRIANRNNIDNIQYSLEQTSFTYPKGEGSREYVLRLLGQYQVGNAVLAIEAARVLNQILDQRNSYDNKKDYRIGEEAIYRGLYHARWNGRFEILAKKPYIIIDGAHNEEAAVTLKKSIEIYFTNKRIIFMIGVLADKDYKSIIKLTAPLADTIITLTPDNPRALSSVQLAMEVKAYCDNVYDAGDLKQALAAALLQAGEDDVIIAFGSLSYLGDLVQALKLRKDER